MFYHVYVIMHVKDPSLSVIRVGHHVLLAGFCLSLYGLHALNRDVNVIQTNKSSRLISNLHIHCGSMMSKAERYVLGYGQLNTAG